MSLEAAPTEVVEAVEVLSAHELKAVDSAAILPTDIEEDEDEKHILARALDWRSQMTPRALFVGAITGIICTFVALNLGLTGAGIAPGYSLIAAIIGYAIMKPLTKVSMQVCNGVAEFTREENCVIQGVATSVQSFTHALGLTSWFFAMHENTAAKVDLGFEKYADFVEFKENNPDRFPLPNTIPLDVGSMIGLAMLISFTGVLCVTFFRKLYIVDLKLPFPSPTATAVLINGFFTKEGRDLAARQLKWFKVAAVATFVATFYVWLTSEGPGEQTCSSFNKIPLFGLAAISYGWYLNAGSYLQFVGIGMILTPTISYSIVLGGILSYGGLFPWIYHTYGLDSNGLNETQVESALEDTDRYWFDQDAGGMDGFYGYKIMWGLALMIGDGLFALCLMGYILVSQYRAKKNGDHSSATTRPKSARNGPALSDGQESEDSVFEPESDEDREFRINALVFTSDNFDNRILLGLFVFFTLLGVIAIPLIYPVPWYTVLVGFIMMPFFSMIGNYIAGLTDWNLTSNFAKLMVLLMGSWGASIDPENAIIIALFGCGIVYCGASNSTDIIGDLKTGFLLRTSPKAMIIAQLFGFFLGAITTPLIFQSFVASYPDTGFDDAKYRNTYGAFYRVMAKLATGGGFEILPYNCLTGTYALFVLGFFMPLMKILIVNFFDKRGYTATKGAFSFWFPSPAAMAIPFMAMVDWVVPVGVGLIIVQTWTYSNPKGKQNFYQIVAAGIIIGNGLWALPEILLNLGKVTPPEALCIQLFDASVYKQSY
jgi:OPT family oligopeptide transporter